MLGRILFMAAAVVIAPLLLLGLWARDQGSLRRRRARAPSESPSSRKVLEADRRY